MGEIIADQLDGALEQKEPAKIIQGAQEVGTWASALPATLTGTIGVQLSSSLDDRITRGEGRALYADLLNLTTVARDRADAAYNERLGEEASVRVEREVRRLPARSSGLNEGDVVFNEGGLVTTEGATVEKVANPS